MKYFIRRPRLGRSSVRGMSSVSEGKIGHFLHTRRWPENITGIIRWGCTASLPNRNYPVWNKASAIHTVNDKSGFRKHVSEKGREDLIPTTCFSKEDVLNDFRFEIDGFIVRPQRHAQGRNLWLVKTEDELDQAISSAGNGWYASNYVNKVAEYRVYVVQGRVATVANKIPDDVNAVAWNVAQGGEFQVVRWGSWPLEVCRVAVEAFNLTGLDFGGVDVMVDENGRPYLIEINSAPSLPFLSDGSISYRQKCMGKAITWLTDGKGVEGCVANTGWRGFIHPAVWRRGNDD